MVLPLTGGYIHWKRVLRVPSWGDSALSRTQRWGVLGTLCRISDDGV